MSMKHLPIMAGLWLASVAGAQAFSLDDSLTLPEPSNIASSTCKPVDPAKAVMQPVTLHKSFADDFHQLDRNVLGTDVGTGWRGYYMHSDRRNMDSHTLSGNKEKELYVYPSYSAAQKDPLGLDPFQITENGLEITASRIAPQNKAALYNFDYTSGLLQSRYLHTQKFGYFEVKAKIPTGKAMWPAFWLLNTKNDWPPEIDVLEVFDGNEAHKITTTTHWKNPSDKSHVMSYCSYEVKNSTTDFNLYGVLWNKDNITYYLNRQPVVQIQTPPGLTESMYMLLNLAVGQQSDATSPDKAIFPVGWVAAYEY